MLTLVGSISLWQLFFSLCALDDPQPENAMQFVDCSYAMNDGISFL
jgi:hypothetical protein